MTFITILSGMAIATQSGMSGQISRILNNPLLAALMIYVSSALFITIGILTLGVEIPELKLVKSIPLHLWFSGGILSVLGLSCVYWLMPKMGVPNVLVGVIFGQVVISMIAGHFGWFDLPVTLFNVQKLIGTMFLVVGIVLINK